MAVELRRCEKRRRLAQNLIRPAQLAHFTLQRLDAILLGSRWPRPEAGVALRLADPPPQRLLRAPELRAIAVIAAPCDEYWGVCSCTNRIARSRTSREKRCFSLLELLMLQTSHRLEPPGIPGRFNVRLSDRADG
jgi:hypothetical protein